MTSGMVAERWHPAVLLATPGMVAERWHPAVSVAPVVVVSAVVVAVDSAD